MVGVDVGGSRVRGALVDVATGRHEASIDQATAEPRSPTGIIDQVASIVRSLGGSGPVGVALPGVIRDGVVERAVNLDDAWTGRDAKALLHVALERPVTLLNDADAAGLAEVRLGAGRGRRGKVVMLTFGTGIGSALLVDGRLVDGTELGQLPVDGTTGELLAAAHAIRRDGLSWPQWTARVDRLLGVVESALHPDLFILGGGISRDAHLWRHLLHPRDSRAERVVAGFLGAAGVVGAALRAREEQQEEEAVTARLR